MIGKTYLETPKETSSLLKVEVLTSTIKSRTIKRQGSDFTLERSGQQVLSIQDCLSKNHENKTSTK